MCVKNRCYVSVPTAIHSPFDKLTAFAQMFAYLRESWKKMDSYRKSCAKQTPNRCSLDLYSLVTMFICEDKANSRRMRSKMRFNSDLSCLMETQQCVLIMLFLGSITLFSAL